MCLHHEKKYLVRYNLVQNTTSKPHCCNPFAIEGHNPKVKKEKTEISVGLASRARCQNIVIRPGLRLCISCRKRLILELTEAEEKIKGSSSQSEAEDESNDPRVRRSSELSKINAEMQVRRPAISPIKMHGRHSNREGDLVNVAKRKLFQVTDDQQIERKRLQREIEDALNINTGSAEIMTKEQSQSDDLDAIVELMKEKLASLSTRSKKIQLLTISPPSWSAGKIAATFPGVTEYMARCAIKLRNEKGICSLPERKKGKKFLIQL